MSELSIKSAAITRTGVHYQDLIGIEIRPARIWWVINQLPSLEPAFTFPEFIFLVLLTLMLFLSAALLLAGLDFLHRWSDGDVLRCRRRRAGSPSHARAAI
ncbi:hypothetical protein CPY51_09110 [Rhizobium tubonense]|uniref:Uncharacterized protein n=1 Tax=Rhizobium tubonense TaxID=484088 RepID=A0A2W4EXZ0_9HYPH|nr:hypothetical protein CPY51_09110 [Rhizobium tubonense]